MQKDVSDVRTNNISKLKKLTRILTLPALLFVFALPACAPKVDLNTLNNQVNQAVEEGEKLIAEGKPDEGANIILTVSSLHPDDPRIHSILDTLPTENLAALEESPLLGFNKKSNRAKVKPSILKRILWYPVDRLKDGFDIISASVNTGPRVGAGVWVTRAVQANAYYGFQYGFGYYQKTGPGIRGEGNAEFNIGPLGPSAVAGAKGGIFGGAAGADFVALHTPGKKLYQDYRDYWGIGFKFALPPPLFVGAEVEFHPIELFDWVAGLFFLDPLNDDFATTRRLKYNSEQKRLMKNIGKSIRALDEKKLERYKRQYPLVSSEAQAKAL